MFCYQLFRKLSEAGLSAISTLIPLWSQVRELRERGRQRHPPTHTLPETDWESNPSIQLRKSNLLTEMMVAPKDILNKDVINNKLGPGPVVQCVLVKCLLSVYQNPCLSLIPGDKVLEYRQEGRRSKRIEGNSRT